MSEEQKQALRALAKLCGRYNLSITSTDGKVHFIFSKFNKFNKSYYVHEFNGYTSKVNQWADVEIGSDE